MVKPETVSVAGGWYVAFCGCGRAHWYDRFTRDGFRHVVAFGWIEDARLDEGGQWLWIDPSTFGLNVALLNHDEMDWMLACLSQRDRATFVFVPHGRPPVPCRVPRFGAYCVSEIERLLGLAPRALRPFGLYRRLLALGAEPAFEELTWAES